jgi:enolase-phosphatase E1
VTVEDSARDLRVVLLDIEGTTTPIAFVYDILFPFARRSLDRWCRTHFGEADYRLVLERLKAEHAEDARAGEHVPPWRDATAAEADRSFQAYVGWLMDRDRKTTGLKLLQGLIWEEGYRSGTLRGEVYADVPVALNRWRKLGLLAAIYSSGSELAQRRLFESTPQGDLTALLAGFFDTRVGPKGDPASYERIASILGVSPKHVMFVSDVGRELAAASSAGCRTVLIVRPGNPPQPDAGSHPHVRTLDEILP